MQTIPRCVGQSRSLPNDSGEESPTGPCSDRVVPTAVPSGVLLVRFSVGTPGFFALTFLQTPLPFFLHLLGYREFHKQMGFLAAWQKWKHR